MSNYPPGVTGNEYEIAGPDSVWEEELDCANCEKTTMFNCESFRGQRSGVCDECESDIDLGHMDYPTPKIEQRILEGISLNLGLTDRDFCEKLASWSDIIRKTFKDGGIDEVISTRRLVHIIRAFAIWNDRLKAIKVCVNRFDDETKQSFLELYDKIDADVTTEEESNAE